MSDVAPPEAVDPELPSRLLHDVMARPEFRAATDAPPAWMSWLDRVREAWAGMPSWFDVVLMTLTVVAGIALVVWLLVDHGGRGRRMAVAGAGDEAETPRESRVTARELYARARAARAEGRHGDAVGFAFRAIVRRLIERGLLLDDDSRTNREHLRTLRRRPEESEVLSAVIPPFERMRYGAIPAVAADADLTLSAARSLFPEEPA
ncbi:MAG: DUF4129 domain-containing protein [bacterium]